MDLEQPQLAVFKYKHGERTGLSGKRMTVFFVTLILAMIVAKLFFPFGVPALFIPLAVFFGGKKTLSIGPRYLICGNQIVYYANVTQLKLFEAEGRLSLQMANGNVVSIDRKKFPSNARKEHKVAANKAAKFNRVTAKIIEKVRRVSPALVADTGSVATDA